MLQTLRSKSSCSVNVAKLVLVGLSDMLSILPVAVRSGVVVVMQAVGGYSTAYRGLGKQEDRGRTTCETRTATVTACLLASPDAIKALWVFCKKEHTTGGLCEYV